MLAKASILLNLALAATLVWILARGRPAQVGLSPAVAEVHSDSAQRALRPSDASTPETPVAREDRGRNRSNWDRSGLASQLKALKESGAPPRVLFAVAHAMLEPGVREKRAAVRRNASRPLWEQALGRTSPEQRQQLTEIDLQRGDEIKALLGDDYEIALQGMLSSTNRPVFGSIAPDLQPAVEQVFSDYTAASRESGSKPLSAQGEIELERKIAKDIAALVGERQALEFMAYNSRTAKELQSAFQGMQGLGDVAYIKVFEAYSTYKNQAGLNLLTQSPRGDMSEDYQLGVLDAISRAAPPNVTLQFVSRQNANFQEMSKIYQAAGFSSEDSIDKYRDFLSTHKVLVELNSPQPGQSQSDFVTMRANAARQVYSILSAGLSGPHLAAFASSRTGRGLLYTASRR